MAILAEGGITLTSVNDACSVLLSPSSCAIHADYDGSNPKLNTAFTDINIIRGNVKLPISSSNVSVIAKSDSGITCAFQTVNSFTQRLLITALPSTILNGSIQIQVTYDSLIMTPTFVFSVERESTMLAWIQDWETRKTQIGSEFIITPKFFAGKKETDNSLTGVYVGPDSTNGAGIYGYHAGTEIFHLNETGGSIGGWNIQNGGISTSDGKLRILSEGSIISLDSDDEVIYGLYKSGEATFANGNVLFHADGSASFKGSITAEGGTIAGWNIASRAIWKSHILLDSLTNYIGLGPAEITNTNLADNTYSHRSAVQTSGGISMFYTSANAYGIEGYLPAVSGQSKLVFKLGDVNKIAGWTFDVNSLVSNYVTLTNQTNNAGAYFSADDISEVASSGLSAHINSGTGVYIKAGSEVVELAGVINGTTVFKLGTSGNQIAGWSFNNVAIWKGSATVQNGFTTAANSMVLTGTGIYGYKWGLNADGSGKLAGGNIAWTSDGGGSLAGGNITWDTQGDATFNGILHANGGNFGIFNIGQAYWNSDQGTIESEYHEGVYGWDLILSPELIRLSGYRTDNNASQSVQIHPFENPDMSDTQAVMAITASGNTKLLYLNGGYVEGFIYDSEIRTSNSSTIAYAHTIFVNSSATVTIYIWQSGEWGGERGREHLIVNIGTGAVKVICGSSYAGVQEQILDTIVSNGNVNELLIQPNVARTFRLINTGSKWCAFR